MLIPPYTIRESSRAKRVILRILPVRGLEVVIPRGFDRKCLPEIVERHGTWISNALERVESTPERDCGHTPTLPKEVCFTAVNLSFDVVFDPTDERRLTLTHGSSMSQLRFTGDCSNAEACLGLLARWLRRQGQLHLIPWLMGLSGELGLGRAKAQVRCQKSRWGSCSSKGTISLNQNLLFLPRELARYILVHELCHTRHMNHSAKFWSLVGACEPDFKSLDARMNGARSLVPEWARRF